MQGYTFQQNNEVIPHDKRAICCFMRQWVMRVSLSDWLAFQARIQGFENPRLLRDRPADGAALRQNLCGVCGHYVQVTASVWKGIWGSLAS